MLYTTLYLRSIVFSIYDICLQRIHDIVGIYWRSFGIIPWTADPGGVSLWAAAQVPARDLGQWNKSPIIAAMVSSR